MISARPLEARPLDYFTELSRPQLTIEGWNGPIHPVTSLTPASTSLAVDAKSVAPCEDNRPLTCRYQPRLESVSETGKAPLIFLDDGRQELTSTPASVDYDDLFGDTDDEEGDSYSPTMCFRRPAYLVSARGGLPPLKQRHRFHHIQHVKQQLRDKAIVEARYDYCDGFDVTYGYSSPSSSSSTLLQTPRDNPRPVFYMEDDDDDDQIFPVRRCLFPSFEPESESEDDENFHSWISAKENDHYPDPAGANTCVNSSLGQTCNVRHRHDEYVNRLSPPFVQTFHYYRGDAKPSAERPPRCDALKRDRKAREDIEKHHIQRYPAHTVKKLRKLRDGARTTWNNFTNLFHA